MRRALAFVAVLVGSAGALAFLVYLISAGIGWPGLPLPVFVASPPWLVNLGLLLVFALQHTGMARQSFKQWVNRWIPSGFERSLYVAASGIALSLLVVCWQPIPGDPLWRGPIWIEAFSVVGWLLVMYSGAWTDPWIFLGFRQADTAQPDIQEPLRIVGPYRYLRHPMMAGLLLAIWAQPIMPMPLLLLNVGMTIYVLIAIRFEEREMIQQFGSAYEAYRRQVPALVPFWPGKSRT